MELIVVVNGVDLVGLAAARQTFWFGYKVVVLEGRYRPGRRVYIEKIGNKAVLARQLSIPLHKVRVNCPLYKSSGEKLIKQ
ncbi:amine oxidase family protein [Medicago truncatula]|uniref:Amine oxidase family protein n=1 Tax=Medicago truncatula TaxID=3880 RepID=G7IDT4_MEDTR|nr:amine oxidase family protein [Medicago truncatula]